MLPTAQFVAATRRQAALRPSEDGASVFDRVREEVDLWKVFQFSAAAPEFNRYKVDQCPNPEHSDTTQSALVFHDGVRCQACGYKGSAVDYYLLFNPELTPYQAAVALLSGEFTLEGNPQGRAREVRTLDQDLALRYHLELARSSAVIEKLEAMGFTKASMRKFHLGWARVLSRLQPDEQHLAETAPNIEWRERDGRQTAYQWQDRFSVPVYQDGRLRQFIYRKADPADLGPKVQLERAAGTGYLFNRDALKGQKYGVYACGWGDVIVLDQWGIPAASGISGDGHWLDEWAEVFGSLPRCYSVIDADNAGLKLRSRLEEKVPWMRHIDLGYPVGTKKDVRDYHLDGHTREDFIKLMKKADQERAWKAINRAR